MDDTRSCLGSCALCAGQATLGIKVMFVGLSVDTEHYINLSPCSAHFTRLETRTKEFIRCINDFFEKRVI